jgi:hypothetical protein
MVPGWFVLMIVAGILAVAVHAAGAGMSALPGRLTGDPVHESQQVPAGEVLAGCGCGADTLAGVADGGRA